MDDCLGIESMAPMEMPARDHPLQNESYKTWWRGNFVYGRMAVVCVKVVTA